LLQLLNDEGLPVIEINEPSVDRGIFSSPVVNPSADGLPLWTDLTPLQREVRQRERDRILDLFEAEEAEEEERAAKATHEQRQRELAARRDAAKNELARLKAQRDLQRRMGKALLVNLQQTREREEKAEDVNKERTTTAPKLKSRKSVSFADIPEDDGAEQKRVSGEDVFKWGDVVPARLGCPEEDTSTEKNRGVMKFHVIERSIRAPSARVTVANSGADSDDESDTAESDSGSVPTSLSNDNTESDKSVDVDTDVLEDEYDLEEAQNHRDVALRYYETRAAIGADALQTMHSHTHEIKEEQLVSHVVQVLSVCYLTQPFRVL
jgi:hypothetical protein